MLKSLKFLLLICLLPLWWNIAEGQTGPQQQILTAPIPIALSQLSLATVGAPGNSTYYYYVIVHYPIGAIASNSFIIRNAPDTLTGGNYIQLNWNPLQGATTYDIVRSKTSPNIFTKGSGGSCNACVVVQGLTATTYNDSIAPSIAYTLNAPSTSSQLIYLNNQDYATPHLLYSTISGPQITIDFTNEPAIFGNITINGTCTGCTSGGSTPVGPAGGDLGGTYPNPTVTNGAHITNSSIPNSGLVNPATTVNGQTCTLGSTCTLTVGTGTVTVVSGPSIFTWATATTTPTATLNSQTQNIFLASPNGSTGVPTFRAIVSADLPSTTTQTIASGSTTLATSAISSAACSSAQTATATGTTTTDAIIVSFNGDPTAVTGYIPLTTGMLTIIPYPTANNVNFKVCNNTSASITPGAVTVNWRVVR